MAEEGFKRKLTAILSADVIGYSQLMRDDEEATVRDLAAYRVLITGIIQQHRGKVIDFPGDNILAGFASVVDAVNGAIKIQGAIKTQNTDVSEKRRMEFRIGINLGDVIEVNNRIYGDGVNIAARVEGLAPDGGICISGTVYEHVKDKLSLEYEYLGERTVKNIPEPIRLYSISSKSSDVSPEESRERSFPDQPSIAVLPFVNISGYPEQEYFSDGITEDLITDLSKISGLFVIARHSVFTYKGKAVKVQEISNDLKVRYILEGSVRKAGERLRITAQLVDAETGGHLWAERYDRELIDIFALQDEVTQKIVAALAVKLTEGEEYRLRRKYSANLQAYDYSLRGLECYSRSTKKESARARRMFQKAIELDPEYALAYSRLGLTYLHEWTHAWSKDPRMLKMAFELAQKAIALDDSLPEAYRILGDVYLYRRQHQKAIDKMEKAIALNPNYADALAGLGDVLNHAGMPEKAIQMVKKAMRLNPHHHAWYFYVLGLAYISTERYEETIEVLKRGVIRNPDFIGIHMLLAALYAEMGRSEEAQDEVQEILRISPNYSIEVLKRVAPVKDQHSLDRIVAALRKAGLK
jgi:TolB-like protein/Tfp pilus assembly protein PilF